MMKRMSFVTILVAVLLFAGCELPHPPLPTDPTNPLKHVAVLPMKNDTNDVEGPDVVRKKMVEALQHRSYIVKDVKETDQILRDQMGITLGGQLDLTTAQKLGETLGVEGVLYGTLMDFDEMTTGVVNVKKVRGKFKLVNTATGQTFWANGLGVKSEQKMSGALGSVGSALSRASDARDKEVPWVIIESTTSQEDNAGKALLKGVGTKLLSKAMGTHLDTESKALARRVTANLPWGPGSGVASAPPAPAFKIKVEVKTPEPPSFGYMDWEGKRDFSAVVHSTSVDKNRNDTFVMEMPLAIAGDKMRMEMDMSKMMKGNAEGKQSPISKMVVLNRGDKKTGYTLYPNVQKYMVHAPGHEDLERPKVDKTPLGSEMIGKYTTTKFRVRITYKDGRTEEGMIWNAQELDGMTIRSEVENKDYRITTELRDIVLRRPPASLFEIPQGYVEAQSFMDLMAQPNK